MRKSKYLILNSIYLKFDDDLINLELIKKFPDNLHILDLLRFNKLSIIKQELNAIENQNKMGNIHFIYLPDNINIIGKLAFYHSNAQYVNFSNCELLNNIQMSAFTYSQLKIVDLSNCINVNIDLYAFDYNLTNMAILPNNITKITSSLFLANNIKKLNLSNYKSLKEIEKYAFSENDIKYLSFPNSIEDIGMESFSDNRIEYLDLLNCINIENISEDAFYGNPLKEIKILDNIKIKYNKNVIFDKWNQFVKYYNETGKRSGDYKYNIKINKWNWDPL